MHIVAYLHLWDILSSVSTSQRCKCIHSTACECSDTLSTVVFCENINSKQLMHVSENKMKELSCYLFERS